MLLVMANALANSPIEAVIVRYGQEYLVLAGLAEVLGSAGVILQIMDGVFRWALLMVPGFFL